MPETPKEPIKMKVFPKGQVVIPIALRKKYAISIGDKIEVIPEADGILLKPAPKKVTRKSLTDRLFGIFNMYATGRPKLTKKDINKAVEKGFIEGDIK
jgi:AbrB family looped-hinge helix DNA binding protein